MTPIGDLADGRDMEEVGVALRKFGEANAIGAEAARALFDALATLPKEIKTGGSNDEGQPAR